MEYLRETTNDWKADYRVPCHTYILHRGKLAGYIKEGTTKEIMFSKSIFFDRKHRTFEKVK